MILKRDAHHLKVLLSDRFIAGGCSGGSCFQNLHNQAFGGCSRSLSGRQLTADDPVPGENIELSFG
jgi:hypothetical protein